MRVLLVGSSSDRARLRSRLNGAFAIVGEFDSLAAARAAELAVDAIVMAERGAASPPPPPVRSRAQAEPWAAPGDDDDGAYDEPLTAREVQVLELLAEGLPNKAIAARLRISDQTVKFHVSSISGKLRAVNRTDAVRRAVRRGLITL
jgi:DNA-binding NarL/FixJ family response regulator